METRKYLDVSSTMSFIGLEGTETNVIVSSTQNWHISDLDLYDPETDS